MIPIYAPTGNFGKAGSAIMIRYSRLLISAATVAVLFFSLPVSAKTIVTSSNGRGTTAPVDDGSVLPFSPQRMAGVAKPRQLIWSAVNRISRAGAEIGPDQRVTPLEGRNAMTINVTYQYGEQPSKGSLEPGKLADLVILSDNPLTIVSAKIGTIQVLETIKDGRSVYRRK